MQLQDIRKQYGDVVAVENVTLDIKAGEFVTLLGASGSGKTTLLRMIAGFLTPDSGRIAVDDVDLTDVPVHKRHIGMVFQNYALFPHMNVYKNVMFPLARQKFPKEERDGLVRKALAAVHLTGFEDRKPKELSGGQQQRVALARAIVTQPRVLLMDEPLGALDRRLRESLQVEIRRLSSELGVTVINVTHDQEEALTMSDRIALLADGKLVQLGTPTELFDQPNSELTARFLGDSNLFRGVPVESGSSTEILLPDGVVKVPGGAAVGEECLVMVRPSRARVAPANGDLAPGLSFVKARVAAVVYAGENRRVVLTRSDGTEVSAVFDAQTPTEVHVGDEARLVWAPRDSTLVSESAAMDEESELASGGR
ncbi:ABC transporter ATP-binding protein [Microbacterium lushaniae]|uniref:ABC transporter ATP-binding protein n=1 Tax=Microbacterium lushaniae TaxID=2614639 RepID=UPI00193106A3|nr:ABC transporter ATP-binding protein [Microbacterium lushaniae]